MRNLLCLAPYMWAMLACAAPLRAQGEVDTIADRPGAVGAKVPRRVLAFYYPWYGNPNVKGGSGRWAHWEGVDEGKRRIATSTHYPLLGPYDSHDPALIDQHCAWAKQAGVDGFIVSWWGQGTFEDRAMGRVLDGCHRAGLAATIYYETVPSPQTAESAAKDIVRVLRQYGKHRAWLTVDGRPVVFVYGRAVDELGLEAWRKVVRQIGKDYEGGAIIIGDRTDPVAAGVFDGIHTYNPAGALANKSADEVRRWARATYAGWVKTAGGLGRIAAVTVIPGYDDTKIRKPGLRVERFEGALYRAQWEEAIAADPHWVLITSWNEWHEGSEIEPSVEDGDRYLKLTAEYAGRFKAGRDRSR